MFRYLICLALVSLLLVPASADATTYYVKPNGNNNLNGLTWDNAWAGPNKTNTSMSAGDTVLFAPGEYDSVLITPKAGDASHVTVYACSSWTTSTTSSPTKRGEIIFHSGLPVPNAWTQHSGNIYYATFTPNTPIWNTAASQRFAFYQRISGRVDSLLVPNMALSGVNSAGKCYFDPSTGRVYVWCWGGGNPGTKIRYASKPIILSNSESHDYNNFIGLDLRGGYQGVVVLGHGGSSIQTAGGGGDHNVFRWCNISIMTVEDANNPAVIYHGNTYSASKSSWSQFNEVKACSISQAHGTSTGEHSGFGIELYASDEWIIDSNVFVDCSAGGLGLKMGNYTDYGFSADNIKFRWNVVIGGSSCGIWFGNKNRGTEICGNYFSGMLTGIKFLTSALSDPIEGEIKIRNNTFVDCQESMIQWNSSNTRGGNIFQYNVVYDVNGTYYANMYFKQNVDIGLETPATETYWLPATGGSVNYNMYYFAPNSFTCQFTSNSGLSGTNFGSWQANGFDINGINGTNPNFDNVSIGNYARTSSSAEINVTHNGMTWTRYGAWQPAGGSCSVPEAPTLVSPINGASGFTSPVTLDWSDVSGIDYYNIQVDDNNDFSSPVANTNVVSSTYSLTGVAGGTIYYWRVYAHNSCGFSVASQTRSFTTACATLSAPTLSTPVNGQTNVTVAATLDWADVSGAGSYECQVDDNSGFSSPDGATVTSSQRAASLSYATTYYWRVRAINVCGSYSWSSIYSFTTEAAPLINYMEAPPSVSSDDCEFYVFNAYNDLVTGSATASIGNYGPENYGYAMRVPMTISSGDVIEHVYAKLTAAVSYSTATAACRIRAEVAQYPSTFSTYAQFAARTWTTAYVDWTFPSMTAGTVYTSPDLKSLIDEVRAIYPAVSNIALRFDNNGSSWTTYRTIAQWDNTSYSDPLIRVELQVAGTPPEPPVLSTPDHDNEATVVSPVFTWQNSTDVNNDVLTYVFELATDSLFTNVLETVSDIAEGATTTSHTTSVVLKNGLCYFWRVRAYDGALYSDFPVPERFIVATTRLIDIDQAWRTAGNGIISAANGFQTGDVVRLTSNISTHDNWGVIVNVDDVILNGQGFSIKNSDFTLPSVTNAGFETADTDTNKPLGWDLTAAPNAKRKAGKYDEGAEWTDPSTLNSGSYSLRFTVPCSPQVVVSEGTYTLEANHNWAICAQYYNQVVNPSVDPNSDSIRITIGMVSTDGDTLFSSEKIIGMMWRGPEPLFVHYKTGGTSVTGKIFFRLRGANNIVTTNDYLWVDDVKIVPFGTMGVGVCIDTTELRETGHTSVRSYDPVGDSMKVLTGRTIMFSGYPTTTTIGDRVKIYDVNISNSDGVMPFGIYCGYRSEGDTIAYCDITTTGADAFNIFYASGINGAVIENTLTLNVDYASARESVPSSNIEMNGGKTSVPRGGYIYGNTMSGSIWCAVNVKSRCDNVIDGTIAYAVPIVRRNTIYCRTKLTNGFAVEFTGSGGVTIDSNTIIAAGGIYHGTGIHVQYQDTDCEQWVNIKDNLIYVSPDTVNQEYPYGTLAYGIQLEQAPRCSVMTNTIWSIVDNVNKPSSYALRLNDGGQRYTKEYIANNFLYGITTGESFNPSVCIGFGSPEVWSYDPADGDTIEIYYNYLYSNNGWIRGFGYIKDMVFNRNTFSLIDTMSNMSWMYSIASSSVRIGPPTEIKFVDNEYGSGQAASIFRSGYMITEPKTTTTVTGSSWAYGHRHIVNVINTSDGLPLSNIEVIAYRANGAMQDIDTTDVYGLVVMRLYEFTDSALSSTYNASYRTNHNPYTIVARTLNRVLADTISVTVDTVKTSNIVLDMEAYPTTNSPAIVTITKPGDGKVFPPLFNADTLSLVDIVDDFGIKDVYVYLRGINNYERLVASYSYPYGGRPVTANIVTSCDFLYADTLVNRIVVAVQDDSLSWAYDSVTISVPIATNITVTFSGKYIRDTWLDGNSGSQATNRATEASFRTSAGGSRGWTYFDITALKSDSLPSIMTVVGGSVAYRCNTLSGSGTLGICDVFKNGAMDTLITYNRFDRLQALEWGSAGANVVGTYPTCLYNVTDAADCDRSTPLSSATPVPGSYSTFAIPDTTLQFIVTGTKPNNGWIIVAASTANAVMYTVESSYQPIGTITYYVPRPGGGPSNSAPSFTTIGDRSVTEGQTLTFGVTASDPDLDNLVLSVPQYSLPLGAVFTDNGNNTGSFSWTPTYTQAGSYSVVFEADDGELSDADTITITVNEAGNQAPVLASIGARSVNENQLLTFTISASDPESVIPQFSATNLPTGATLVDNSNGTATFSWTPTYAQSGLYNITFIASDGSATDQEIVGITVNNVNRPPVLSSIGSKSCLEGQYLSFTITASDPDVGQSISFSMENNPSGSVLNSVNATTSMFGWTPTMLQSGTYNVRFIVADQAAAADSEIVQITVTDVVDSDRDTLIISGTEIQDCYLRGTNTTTMNLNYGTYTSGSHAMFCWPTGHSLIRPVGYETLLPANAIIIDAWLELYAAQVTTAGTVYAYGVFKPWVEGTSDGGSSSGASYNHWDVSGSKYWGTISCANAADYPYGDDNSLVSAGYDRTSTPVGSVSLSAVGSARININPFWVQLVSDGALINNGFLLSSSVNAIGFRQSEYTTNPAQTPKFYVVYRTGTFASKGGIMSRGVLSGIKSGMIE